MSGNSCGLVTSYKLSSAVFGGLQQRRLGIAFQLSLRANCDVPQSPLVARSA